MNRYNAFRIFRSSPLRSLHLAAVSKAKGDASTIDSFRLPSQTSINEWEFRYDFMPVVSSPKVPAVNREAVRKDIATEKAKSVAQEMFVLESNSSIKVEANTASVVHGGEPVASSPEQIPIELDKSTLETLNSSARRHHQTPIKKDRAKYVQTSINSDINKNDVHIRGNAAVHIPQ